MIQPPEKSSTFCIKSHYIQANPKPSHFGQNSLLNFSNPENRVRINTVLTVFIIHLRDLVVKKIVKVLAVSLTRSQSLLKSWKTVRSFKLPRRQLQTVELLKKIYLRGR